MTLIEMVAILLWLISGIIGAWFGGVLGFVIGIVAPYALVKAYIIVDSWRFPDLPPCRHGVCNATKGYVAKSAADIGIVYVCGCGDEYMLSPRRARGNRYFRRVLSPAEITKSVSGKTLSYLFHRQFGKWQPDTSSPVVRIDEV